MNHKSTPKTNRRRAAPMLLSVLVLAATVLVCCLLVFLRLHQFPERQEAAETSSVAVSDSLPDVSAEPVSAPDVSESIIPPSAEPAVEISSEDNEITDVSVTETGTDSESLSESPFSDRPAIDIHSWEYLLANSYNGIGGYEPPYESYQDQGIDERILDAADAFLSAARNAGYNAYYSTIYRNYEYQDNHFNGYYMNRAGEDPIKAVDNYLPPGFSDHQTGLSVDFTDSVGYSALYEDFDDGYMRDTDLYRWATEHCAEYGFVLRYPPGKEMYYGTPCNHPAHFRYVGKEAAAYMTEHNLCLEEFIMLYDESLVFAPEA